jgi:signal transduction histidine kinase
MLNSKVDGSFIIKNDKLIILVTFLLIFFIFLVSFIKELEHRKDTLSTYITQKQETIDSIYATKINTIRTMYHIRLKSIIATQSFKDAIISRDMDTAKSVLSQEYKFMHAENSFIKTLYYVNQNNICQYRAHNPEKKGDDVSCHMPIIEETNDTKEHLNMFDAGEYGVYYRITAPILYNNVHYGVLELGVDFKLFVRKFEQIVEDAQGILLVKNAQVSKKSKLPEYQGYRVITNDTNVDINQVDMSQDELKIGDKYYYIDKNFDIRGIGKKEIARVLFLIDITKYKKEYFDSIVKESIIFAISSILILAIFYFSFKLYRKELEKKSQEARKKDQYIKEKLQDEVDQRVKELKNQERIMLEQSKLAIMGEMIGMIAHQWRQPLSHITLTLGSYMTIYQMNGELSKEQLDDMDTKIHERVEYLSGTIDGFRKFFQPNEEKEIVEVEYIINKSIEFVEYSLNDLEIKVTKDIECDAKLNIYLSNFIQTMINIIKNAEDALIDNRENDREISIKCFEKDNRVNILIKDNAGGIPEDIIAKIFEPYFSTKSKNSSGVGLYMCKMTVDKHLDGLLTAYNEDDGAVFKIELPTV